MKVPCDVAEVNDLELSDGLGAEISDLPGCHIDCRRCGREESFFFNKRLNVKACLELMKEDCPRKEANEYVTYSQYDGDESYEL